MHTLDVGRLGLKRNLSRISLRFLADLLQIIINHQIMLRPNSYIVLLPLFFRKKSAPIGRFLHSKSHPFLVAHPWYDPIWECPPPRAVAVPNKIRITKFGSTTAMAGRMNQTFLLGSTLPCVRQILPIARLCTAFIHTFIFFPNLILL